MEMEMEWQIIFSNKTYFISVAYKGYVKCDRELFFSNEFMSSGLEWTTFERNYFAASVKFDNKSKTFEAKIIQEP